MRVDEPCRLAQRHMVSDQLFGFGDQLRCLGACHVHTQQHACAGIVGILTADNGHGAG